jgi:uncharacterized protein YecE (DUF72 family)
MLPWRVRIAKGGGQGKECSGWGRGPLQTGAAKQVIIRVMGTIRVGIGGWTYAPWRGRFFPAGLPHARELAYAAERLSSIEINGTFYRHQTSASFAAWRDAVPDGFVFAVKAHRATTHGKAPAEAVARFLASGVTELGDRLGPILWQLPYNRKFSPEALRDFLALLPAAHAGVALRHAVEARHPSFATPEAQELFRAAKVAAAIIDSDKQVLDLTLTAPFVYARLQRNQLAAPEGYAADGLDDWAAKARTWARAKGLDVFVYFIAGDKERAPDSAMAFMRRLSG